jgi:transcription antitermination factor NusG
VQLIDGHNECDREGGAVSSAHQITTWLQTIPGSAVATMPANWYAVQTRSRHERFVCHHLQSRGIAHYLPMVTEIHRWSDRRKKVVLPLFSGYVFVQVPPTNEERVRVLQVDGVVRFVGHAVEGTPIPDEQIESIRMLVDQKLPCSAHPFLKVGQRVRIRGGALDGMEGIFQSRNGEDMLVISVDALQRSLSVSIRGYSIDVI